MKAKYVIFYSWLSDLPAKDNRSLIRNVLEKEAKIIGKDLGVSIIVDSDSRGEDGSDSIDDVILRKIANADFFVADVTPVNKCLLPFKRKYIPNPNVQFELGYAASTLGWNRCIMVWNSNYGDVKYAPFDIRNHSIVPYKSPENPDLHKIIKDKIAGFDELIKNWRSSKERSFDVEKYKQITDICSERDLVDSIDSFFNNRYYNQLEFDWWDNIYYNYTHYPDNHFLDDELHNSFSEFLKNLQAMELIAAKYNKQTSYSDRPAEEIGTDDYKREYRIGAAQNDMQNNKCPTAVP